MALDKRAIIEEYNKKVVIYNNFAKHLDNYLKRLVKQNKIKVHSITFRIKTLDSFLDKVQRKNPTNPFEEIHDIIGFRIICLFLSDIETIGNLIKKEFIVLNEDNKIFNTEPSLFGYMSLHFKVKIKSNDNENFNKIPFEIQVRTITQDAWASISHHLDYKKKTDIPEELKKDFQALSGLFYVADTHFFLIKQELSKRFSKELETQIQIQERNKGDK